MNTVSPGWVFTERQVEEYFAGPQAAKFLGYLSQHQAIPIATRNDFLKVSVKRQQAAVDRMRLESGLRLAARDLRRHVGLSEGDEIVLADALAPPEDPAVLRDRSEAGPDRRPELRQLQRGVRAEELQGALEKGERLPSVSVGAMALRHDFSGLNRYQDVLVYGTVTVPISAFWEKHHTVAAQEARAEVARTRLADTRKLVAIEIEKAWADLQAGYRAAQVAEAAIEQAEVNLREERDRYDNGFVTLSDLLEAEVLLHQAQDQRIEARRAYCLSRSAYLRATGEPS